MRQALSDLLVAAAEADPRFVLLTGDHGYALFDALRRARPDQFLNCGVAEQNMVGMAAGLARAGLRPVVYGLAAFVPMRVLEQIRLDLCYDPLPVVLLGDGAGVVYSTLGASHQCTEDVAALRPIGDLAILSPCDALELQAAFGWAIARSGPTYLRLGKADRGAVHDAPPVFAEGRPIPVRAGAARPALLATGSMVRTALAVAERLDLAVYSVPWIEPVDRDTILAIAREHGSLVTIEEHDVRGGLGAMVSEITAESFPVPVLRIGTDRRFSATAGTWEHLLREHGLDVDAVTARVAARIASPVRS